MNCSNILVMWATDRKIFDYGLVLPEIEDYPGG